jgi:glycerophosphoryl diester phosphodiesterase
MPAPHAAESPRPLEERIVIAHRGASGYLPEHTLVAKAYAHALGADYLEQDVVLTQDDVPVVFHDLVLEDVTDVAAAYPDRRSADSHWYVLDFTWAELQRLALRERVDASTGLAAWPGRFRTAGVPPLRIPSLAEELAFVRALNAATGREAGVYTEVKSPAWHRARGRDPSATVLRTLAEHGYRNHTDRAYLQCFDAAELRRVRFELGSELKLVQLIGENAWAESGDDYDAMRTAAGLQDVASWADGIGPWIPHVLHWDAGVPVPTPLVADARAAGLVVHPYTVRIDQLPAGARDADALHHALFAVAGVDGVFTDFPDHTLRWLRREAALGRATSQRQGNAAESSRPTEDPG